MKRHILFIAALLIVLPYILPAQSIRRAEKLMEKYDYSKATRVLKKAVNADSKRAQAIPLLAECYRLQRDVFNSKAWYAQAVSQPNAKPEMYYEYGKALQSTGDYSQAREMFQKNALGASKVSHCDSVLGPWKDLLPGYEIKTVNKINTSESDFGPALYSGDLIYASDYSKAVDRSSSYGWTGRGYLDIMKSTPEAPGEYWGDMKLPSTLKGKFNQEFHDGPACFSTDGNSIYFTRSYRDKARKEGKYRTNLLKVFYSEKSDGKWGEIKEFYLNSKDYSVGHPSLSADGQTLYFVSDMPGGKGGTDIWMCKKQGEGWGEAVNLGSTINTAQDEMFPTMRENGCLYFSSDGHPGYGALDVFKSRNTNGEWSTPQNLHQPLNSSFDDFAMAFVPGAKNGFFSSNRPGGVGNDDIYAFREIEQPKVVIAKQPEPEKPAPAYLMGVVKDKVTMKPIENATVFALNPNTGKVLVMKTGPDGVYKAPVERPGEFTVKAMKPTYISDCTPFPILEIKPGTTTEAPRELLLDKLELNRVFRIDNIYYDFDKYNIRADAQVELEKVIKVLMENPINVELGSHTDCRGSFAYNDRLSQNRANSAVTYIVSRGISSSRITAKGYGEHQLTNKCADGVFCSEADHQLNRRTEFKVIEYSTPQQQVGQFNPDLFNKGEELDSRLLPAGFFNPCK